MPISPTYPGVYIEELPSGVRTIVGVSTSVAAFLGYFARGPLNNPVQIFNMGDFEREFGGLHKKSEASYAISQFFLNGGSQSWVVRTASADVANPLRTASVVLKDGAGTDVLTASAAAESRVSKQTIRCVGECFENRSGLQSVLRKEFGSDAAFQPHGERSWNSKRASGRAADRIVPQSLHGSGR